MATLRSGPGLPSRPNEGVRSRKLPQPNPLLSPPKVSSRTGRQVPESMRATSSTILQPRTASRVPQPSTRLPSAPQSTRPTPGYQMQPRATSSTAPSARPRASSRGGSGSSSSGRSVEGTLRPAPNVLRRKKSSLSNEAATSRNNSSRTSSSSSIPRSRASLDAPLGIHLDRGITDSPAEIKVAEVMEIQKPPVQTPVIYPELDRYRNTRRPSNTSETEFEVPFRIATHDLPPPTPASILFSGTSGSPSTRFSESPGPGPYSRDTTPTSICSQSPGLIVPFRLNQSKMRLNTPPETRPPVTRRRAGSFPNEVESSSVDPHGLAAVRESLNSSSSNSTVRELERSTKERKTRRLPPPPPSPPPRKSSQNFRTSSEEVSPLKPARKVSRPTNASAPLEPTIKSPQATTSLSPRATPPSRPSRDGTPDIHSQLFGPLPIIHSNLSTQSLPYERRGSEPTIQGALQRTSNQLSQADRNASTSRLPLGDASSVPKAAPSNDQRKVTAKTELPRPARTPSPIVTSTSTFNTRFPFFGRKKATGESTSTEKKDKEKKKVIRKGPTAGTGHEGYGRLGAVRRRSGSAPRPSPGNQSSQESLASHDAFLAERMNPVIIAGGEIIENRNTSSEMERTESSQSLASDQPRASSESSSNARTTLWPSAMARTPHPGPRSRRPSDSDSEGVTMKSTLAYRRSVQRLRSSPENPLRLPHPINTSGTTSSPMTSFDTSIMSDDSHFELQREISREANPVQPAPKKLVKRSRSPRKWNLFGRSQPQPTSKKSDKVTATVTIKPPEKKPMAFYMMDSSEQDDSEPMDVQEVLRRANVFGSSPNLAATPERQAQSPLTPEVPSPAKKTAPQLAPPTRQAIPATNVPRPKVTTNPRTNEKPKPATPATATLSSGRPSRLPQVGRIPKVVSNRPEHVSPKSFSRPFRASLQLAPRTPEVYDEASIAKGPTPPKPSTPVPDLTTEGSTLGSGTNVSPSRGSNRGPSFDLAHHGKEFLAFSPRKDSSDGTIGTSSSSCSGLYAFSGSTAVIPLPNDPPAEDEIWDEYNDLLGDEHSKNDNPKDPASASSSKGVPFHLETYHSKLAKEKPMESPTIMVDDRKASTISKATTRSSSYSADMTERIRNAFQPHPSPSSNTFSVSEFVSGYEKRNKSTELSQKLSSSRRSSHSSRKERNSHSSSTSDDASPLAQVNLRVGSMTVSKWLTFGHVLFSDVRHDLVPVDGSLKRHSILVLDGLGNDDWSFYAAETYPAATFFNLSPRAPLPADLQTSPSSFPLSPPNHHQIQYTSHADKFPFAPQSFTALVYRFPIAAPESHYRNILTEARRVLKPGGYIELSILDVDLNNMGNRGRRVVRRLKEKIHEESPETNLSSTADLIVRLLGKAGFSNIKAARVGVPVASSVTPSSGTEDNARSMGESKPKKDQPSLSEMMSDNSPLADEGITKMVSRVGRWWYTRCYEGAAGNLGGKSLWNDRTLLRECEELGTSLKLMVCCARAPDRITSF